MTNRAAGQEVGKKKWRLRFICCGLDDGTWDFYTWEEADKFRGDYVHVRGHDRAAILERVPDAQHEADQESAQGWEERYTRLKAEWTASVTQQIATATADAQREIDILRSVIRDKETNLLEVLDRLKAQEAQLAEAQREIERLRKEQR